MNKFQFVLNRSGLVLKKHAPDILFGAGLVGLVGAAVWAAKESRKFDEVAEENSELIEVTRNAAQAKLNKGVITVKEAQTEMGEVYIHAIGQWVKLYGGPVALGVASIVALITGHVKTKERAAAVMSAYALLDGSFKTYRSRVQEQLGVEQDAKFLHGVFDEEGKQLKRAVEEIDESTGRKKKKQYDLYNCGSQYARLFDEYNRHWRQFPDMNRFWLQTTERWLNDKLITRGHVFLNEVYDELGFERTPEGQMVGWVLDPDVHGRMGDGHIDLGLLSPINQTFIDGVDPTVIIDPNVDGVIYDLL